MCSNDYFLQGQTTEPASNLFENQAAAAESEVDFGRQSVAKAIPQALETRRGSHQRLLSLQKVHVRLVTCIVAEQGDGGRT